MSYSTVHVVWNRLAGPPGDVCAGEEMTGGADEVAVELPDWVDVLFVSAVALALGIAAPVAFATDGEGIGFRAADDTAEADDAWPTPDERAPFGVADDGDTWGTGVGAEALAARL